MEAYLYARWSSLEQSKGSTLDRQIKNCEAYALEHGLEVRETIIDRGRSAYTGENISSGNLGTFASRVESGSIALPACLIVEELDRLSRQPADVMLRWLSPLIRSGLAIVVTQSGRTIDADMLDRDMGSLMMLMIGAFGSHEESRKKSERVSAAWIRKREEALAGNPVQRNHRSPLWLTVVEGQFEIIPERGETIAHIFKRRVEGLGKGAIAQELNANRVPTWSRAEHWTPTYVGRVLSNRAVIGEWQPHVWPRKAKARQPVGEPVGDFYPEVVSAEVFVAANERRLKSELSGQGRGRSLSNLIGSKATCAKCGGRMTARGASRYRTNRDGSKTRHYFLYCERAKIAKACSHEKGWTYDRVEKPLLDNLLTLALDDGYFSAGTDLTAFEAAVLSAKATVSELSTRAGRLLDLVEDGDALASGRYRVLQGKLEDALRKLEEADAALQEARGSVSPDEHLKRVSEVRELIESEDPEIRFQARRRVKSALHDLITAMVFDPDREQIDVRLVAGLGAMWIARDGWSHFENFYRFPHKVGDLASEEREVAQGYIRRVGEPSADSAFGSE